MSVRPHWMLGKRLGRRCYIGRCTRTHHVAVLCSGKGTYCLWHRLRHPQVRLTIEEAAREVVEIWQTPETIDSATDLDSAIDELALALERCA